jgi:hypothetical protein
MCSSPECVYCRDDTPEEELGRITWGLHEVLVGLTNENYYPLISFLKKNAHCYNGTVDIFESIDTLATKLKARSWK